jgi:small-conductance mechanosensitive channel
MKILLEQTFWQSVLDWLVSHGLRILLMVGISALALYLLRRLSRRLELWIVAQEEDPVQALELRQRAQTIRRLLDGVLLFLVVVIIGAMVLMELGVQVAPFLAGAGVVGIAISLGAQSLVKDILAGILILVEDQFAIGDSVAVAGVSGVVERMTLRSTVLRDLEGTAHIVPNGEMRVVSNKTKGWSRVVLRVGVSYDTDLERAMEVLRQIGQGLVKDSDWGSRLLEEPTVAGVDDLRASDIALLVLIKTLPGAQWAVAREARQRIVETFAREGIEMPYPTEVRLTRALGGGAPVPNS